MPQEMQSKRRLRCQPYSRLRRSTNLLLKPGPGLLLRPSGVVKVVPAIPVEITATPEILLLLVPAPEPGKVELCALRLFTAILAPLDPGRLPENALASESFRHHERPDVHPDTVIEVRFPAYRLLVERFPANKQVVRRPTIEDLSKLFLEVERRGQLGIRTLFALLL